MRLRIVRILITAASLISLSLPASATVAASANAIAAPRLHADAAPGDMGAQAVLLRSLMVERHALIQRIVAPDAQRGQLLTLAALGAADAILAGDAAALRQAIDAASKTAQRRDSAHTVLWLTPAGPGALWSPLAWALAPGPLAWAPPLRRQATGDRRQDGGSLSPSTYCLLPAARCLLPAASPAPLQEPLTLPLQESLTLPLVLSPAELVLSPAKLTARPAFPRLRATPPPPSAQPTATVSSYLLPMAAPAQSAPEPAALTRPEEQTSLSVRSFRAGAAASQQAASLGDPLFGAPSHGRLMVDAGEGAVPIAGANAAVAAAELVPAAVPWPHARQRRGALPRPERPPTLAALQRRWRAVSAALAQVRALEAWAGTTAPTPVMTSDDVIPSSDVLHQRLDHWRAFPSLAGNPLTGSARSAAGRMPATPTGQIRRQATGNRRQDRAAMESPAMALGRWEYPGHGPVLPTAAPSSGAGADHPSVTAPAETLGTRLTLTIGGKVAGAAISSTLSGRGRAGASVSSISDTAATNLAASEIDVPVALSPLPTSTVTATVGAPDRSTLVTATPAQTATGNVAASSVASPTAQSTFAPQSSSTPTPSAGQGYSQAGTATPGASALMSATTPLTPVAPITTPVTLDAAIAGATPALTITTALSATSPFTLVVTLPVTAARVLAPPGFSSQRVALERVLRQGEALYAQIQAAEQPAEQAYRARLRAVADLNTAIENGWYARYQAYLHYQHTFPAYVRRVAAFNAYAHQLHLARLRQEQWRTRLAAWTRYAQDMAAYKMALAARQRAPAIPISGTAPLTATPGSPSAAPLPPKPVMPPFPGPEPPPFSKPPPPWPGSRPVYVANPGPEPAGYPLPLPPEAAPPWDGVAVPITVLSYGGLALGVGAAGREETTQDALLVAGAFDGIGSYQDPIKGIITTYWGGRTIFQSFHPGIDIAAPLYTPIHAAAAGRVMWAGYAAPGQRHYSYGLCVIIQHNDHFSTLYAHLDDEKYGLQVRVGDIVQQGQVIGYEGLTGWTTGPHLHFEIRQDNVQVNPLLLIPNPQD